MPIFSSTVNDLQSGASYFLDGSSYLAFNALDGTHAIPSNTSWSYELWFKITKHDTSEASYVFSTTEHSLYIHIDGRAIFSDSLSGSNYVSFIPEVGKWYHIVSVQDSVSDITTVYSNGVSVGTKTYSGDTDPWEVDMGRHPWVGGYYFEGEVSLLRVYNRALTADEVVDSYNGQGVPYEYRGASQTELISLDDGNSDGLWDGFQTHGSGAGNLTTTIVSGEQRLTGDKLWTGYLLSGGTTAEVPSGRDLIPGKKYRFTGKSRVVSGDSSVYVAVNASAGFQPNFESGNSSIGGGGNVANHGGTSFLSWDIVFTADTNLFVAYYAVSGGSTSSVVAFSDVGLKQIGCVAEFLPTGISADNWIDTSGNDLHGTVTGAIATNHKRGSLTLENIHTTSMAFAGTVNDSALDSYEEGSFTPVITGSTLGTWNATGQYTRIGNTVHIIISEYETLSPLDLIGNVSITGLPYEPASWQSIGFLPTRGGYEQGYGLEYTPWAVIDTNSVMHLHDYSQMNYINAYSTLAATYNANNFKQNGVTTLILDWQFSYLID